MPEDPDTADDDHRRIEAAKGGDLRGLGRPCKLDRDDAGAFAALRDLDDLSWNEIAQRAGLRRSTVRDAVLRADAELLGLSAHRQDVSRSSLESTCAEPGSTSANIAVPQANPDVQVTHGCALVPGASLGAVGREKELKWDLPTGEALVDATSSAVNAAVDVAGRCGMHPVRVSFSITESELLDWPARWDLLRRGRPLAEALYGWEPTDALDLVLSEAAAAVVSLDLSVLGRPHLYGIAVMPMDVTPATIDRRWSLATGAREGGRLVDRVRTLHTWDRHAEQTVLGALSDYRSEGAVRQLEHLREGLRRDVMNVVSYLLKGADRSLRDRDPWRYLLPATLPPAIRSRAAHEFIVHAFGISIRAQVPDVIAYEVAEMHARGAPELEMQAAIDALARATPFIDLREILAGRLACVTTMQRAETLRACNEEHARRNSYCRGCGQPLPTVRRALRHKRLTIGVVDGIHMEVPSSIRVPRFDRRYCSGTCRKRDSRAHRVTLAKLAAILRRQCRLESR